MSTLDDAIREVVRSEIRAETVNDIAGLAERVERLESAENRQGAFRRAWLAALDREARGINEMKRTAIDADAAAKEIDQHSFERIRMGIGYPLPSELAAIIRKHAKPVVVTGEMVVDAFATTSLANWMYPEQCEQIAAALTAALSKQNTPDSGR